MQFRPSITVIVASVAILFTLSAGTTAWMGLGHGFGNALYRTALAFVGDGIYAEAPVTGNATLSLVRFSGMLSTVVAILAVVLAFFRQQWQGLQARLRRGHIVIIGSSRFALSRYEGYAAERKLVVTVIDEIGQSNALVPGRNSTIMLTVDMLEVDTIGKLLGRSPELVVFGDRNSSLNLERAQMLSLSSNLSVRIEESSIARDLDFLAPELGNADVFSINQTLARSLVTQIAPTYLAQLRQQDYVHIAILGFDSMAISIIEEFALRCHMPGLGQVMISVFDMDIKAAEIRLNSERPGLKRSAAIHFYALDRLDDDGLQPMFEVEKEHPFTAIVIATGTDVRNTEMALRLRQAQNERLCLKAPVFVHRDGRISAKENLAYNLTGGVVVFGGREIQNSNNGLETFHETLAESLHATWICKQPTEIQTDHAWANLSYSQRRSSYRAALSAVELLRACGLSPDPGSGIAGMRVAKEVVQNIKGNPQLVNKLVRNEHQRWMSEKLADGYTPQPDGLRDNEKKLHPMIMPFDNLSELEKKKDLAVINHILDQCTNRAAKEPEASAWRKILRVGIYGPLKYDLEKNTELGKKFGQFIASLPLPTSAYSLEIITPDAPGFDRIGATALARQWEELTSRKATVIAMRSASEKVLNILAEEYVPLKQSEAQSAAMLDSVGGLKSIVDMRPTGVSDADLINNQSLFFQCVDANGIHINAISDLVIAVTNKNRSSYSCTALENRIKSGKATIEIKQG